MNSDSGIAKTEPIGNGCGGGATTAGGQSIACSSFPYFNADVLTVNDSQKLNVRPMREARVCLNQRSIVPGKRGRDFIAKNNAVRVSHGSGTILKGRTTNIHMLSQYFTLLSGNRYLCAQKTHLSHFHSHGLSATLDMTDDSSAKGLYRKRVLMH